MNEACTSLWIGALAAFGVVRAATAAAQTGLEQAPPCTQRWTYDRGPTTSYLSPLFVSDAAGDFFWWEHTGTAELVAVREGKTRWRRQLSALTRPGPFMVSATLMRDDVLVVSFDSTILGLRTADGHVIWSRHLEADLAAELRGAGLPPNTELATGPAARVGSVLVTGVAATAGAGWLVATTPDGRSAWRTRIVGAAARMVADSDHVYVLLSQVNSGDPPIVAVDRNGNAAPGSAPSPVAAAALSGGEVVSDGDQVVTARVAPMGIKCPPGAPCRPPPLVLTVVGSAGDRELWHLSHAAGLTRMQLLLLADGGVLLVENRHVGSISPDGTLTPLCELPTDDMRSIAGLAHGNLVVVRREGVNAYAIPGAPQLATVGWTMHGGGPEQGWTMGAARAAPFVPFPAGVADPASGVAYAQTDEGVTTALALSDGSVKWHTRVHARPVGIWHGRVIVLEPDTAALRVVELDPRSGVALHTSQPIPIRDWDSPTLVPWGEPLWTDVRMDGNQARVAWEVSINGRPGGAQIRPYGAAGVANVDLESGAVAVISTKSLEGPRPIRPSLSTRGTIVGGRSFSLVYAATATLTARDAKSGRKLWSRQLWSFALPERQLPTPP